MSCKLFHIFILLKTNYSLQAEKVHELNEDIGKLLAKAEQLGAEGNVDESQKILMEVEKVRAKKKEAEVQCWLSCELSQEPGPGWVVLASVPVCQHLLFSSSHVPANRWQCGVVDEKIFRNFNLVQGADWGRGGLHPLKYLVTSPLQGEISG